MKLDFIKATQEDLPEIMDIIHNAQQYFMSKGIPQWQNGFPGQEVILEDIKNGASYVAKADGKVMATAALCQGDEPTYAKIYDGGHWLSDSSYLTIHRIAVNPLCKGAGIAGKFFDFAVKLCEQNNIHSIRIDTHVSNLSMQSAIKKFEFSYCGIIHLENGDERIAFEKII